MRSFRWDAHAKVSWRRLIALTATAVFAFSIVSSKGAYAATTVVPPPDYDLLTESDDQVWDNSIQGTTTESENNIEDIEETTMTSRGSKLLRNGRRYTPLDESDEEFCYTRPDCGPGSDLWGGQCMEGERQSPVDIMRYNVVPSAWGGPIYLNPDYRLPQEFYVMNSGHTVSVMLNSDLSSRATIVVGGSEKLMYGGTFAFAQVHFHWGSVGSQGSEHTLDGKRYAMEGHFVHYNTKYDNFSEAMTKKDGLAIFGVFYEESYKDNLALDPIISVFDAVRDSRKMYPGSGLQLTKLIPVMQKEPKNAYHYQGSLTTPECSETVTWIVFEKKLSVSRRQLEAFRSIIDSNGDRMVDNFRPTQPLHRRKIRKISVYCGDDCEEETELSLYSGPNSIFGKRTGRFHFPLVIVGPQLRTSINPAEILLSSINLSLYILTISWIISLMKNSYTLF